MASRELRNVTGFKLLGSEVFFWQIHRIVRWLIRKEFFTFDTHPSHKGKTFPDGQGKIKRAQNQCFYYIFRVSAHGSTFFLPIYFIGKTKEKLKEKRQNFDALFLGGKIHFRMGTDPSLTINHYSICYKP